MPSGRSSSGKSMAASRWASVPQAQRAPILVEAMQRAIHLLQGLAPLLVGLGGDQVGDSLGPGEVELAVLEGAARELAGLGHAAETQLGDGVQRTARPRRARHAGAARPWSRRSRCWAPRTTRPGRGRSPRRSRDRRGVRSAMRRGSGRAGSRAEWPRSKARRSVRKISASRRAGAAEADDRDRPGMRPRRRTACPAHRSCSTSIRCARLAGRRTVGPASGVAPGGGCGHDLVGDLVVQRLGDQAALDQLGLGPERPGRG